ncbi:hypothetical protein [Streptomyces sp. NPDC007172]
MARLCSPVVLDLGACAAESTAQSFAAEDIATRESGTGPHGPERAEPP